MTTGTALPTTMTYFPSAVVSPLGFSHSIVVTATASNDHATELSLSPGFIYIHCVLRALECCYTTLLCFHTCCPLDVIQTCSVLRAFSVCSVLVAPSSLQHCPMKRSHSPPLFLQISCCLFARISTDMPFPRLSHVACIHIDPPSCAAV